jgi:hypothetical protein
MANCLLYPRANREERPSYVRGTTRIFSTYRLRVDSGKDFLLSLSGMHSNRMKASGDGSDQAGNMRAEREDHAQIAHRASSDGSASCRPISLASARSNCSRNSESAASALGS